jgi:GH18 family chitinase
MLVSLAAVLLAPPVLAGYLPAWKTDTYEFDRLATLTHVLYFSAKPAPDGTLDLTDLRLPDLPKLAAAKRKHGFRLLLCVGGWERSAEFPAVAKDREKTTRFVESVDRFLGAHGFDGVDLDWEHPTTAEEGEAYGSLIQSLKQRLAPKGQIVTAAIAAWQTMSKSAVEGLDQVHLMSYDHDGRHATPEQAALDVQKLRSMGFPPNRIVMGVPLYGRNIKNRHDAREYRDLVKAFSPKDAEDEAGDYYFNGRNTVIAKAKWAKAEGLAGLMVWEATQDIEGERSLLVAMRRALGLK